jgi:hypothetical protein
VESAIGYAEPLETATTGFASAKLAVGSKAYPREYLVEATWGHSNSVGADDGMGEGCGVGTGVGKRVGNSRFDLTWILAREILVPHEVATSASKLPPVKKSCRAASSAA